MIFEDVCLLKGQFFPCGIPAPAAEKDYHENQEQE